MDAGPIKSHQKPESIFSGFFIVVLLLLSPAHGQPPSELLRELLWGRDVPCARGADSAATPLRAIVTAVYNDCYFDERVDTNASRKVLEKTGVYSPRFNAAIALNRASWGAMVQGQAGMISLERHSNAEEYDYSVGAPFNAVSGEGWLRMEPLHLLGMLGYDKGLPAAYAIDGKESFMERLRALPADPRFMHALSATYSITPLSFGLYEKKQPLLSALCRIENNQNHNAIELPVASADQEYGVFSTFRMGQDSCGMTIGYVTISSDTGPARNTAMPVTITGNGWRYRIDAAAASIPLSPWLCTAWHSREMQLRGYDGNAPDPYCHLDSTLFFHSRFETGFNLPWKLDNSIFVESAAFCSKRHGQFDPYPFSAFTIFDPVKYRLDTFGIQYRSAGATVERAFSMFRRDCAITRLTLAWFELEGSLVTREYDFSFLFPRLINPRSWSLADEHRFLVIPELLYSFRWAGLTCTGSLRQIIPIDIAKSGGHGGVSSFRRTVRGGTTAKITIEYCR